MFFGDDHVSMQSMGDILAIIPARSGSKAIRDKNIQLIAGRPLLVHSIEHALKSALISRVIVSTDSEKYAEIARVAGADVPFLRPTEFAQDLSTDLDVFLHALDWLQEHEQYRPEMCVHLRPTYPMRNAQDIDVLIRILQDHPDIHSVRTVVSAPKTPFKMWYRGEDHFLTPVIQSDMHDAYNLPRQLLPPVYAQNGCIDVVRTSVILEKHSMTGEKIYGYVMDEEGIDINTLDDFERVALTIADRI